MRKKTVSRGGPRSVLNSSVSSMYSTRIQRSRWVRGSGENLQCPGGRRLHAFAAAPAVRSSVLQNQEPPPVRVCSCSSCAPSVLENGTILEDSSFRKETRRRLLCAVRTLCARRHHSHRINLKFYHHHALYKCIGNIRQMTSVYFPNR